MGFLFVVGCRVMKKKLVVLGLLVVVLVLVIVGFCFWLFLVFKEFDNYVYIRVVVVVDVK